MTKSCAALQTDVEPTAGVCIYRPNNNELTYSRYRMILLRGAAAIDVCEEGQWTTAASMVRPLPRESRRRAAADRGAGVMTRRSRTNFTGDQLQRLCQCFADSPYINVNQRAEIAAALELTQTQVGGLGGGADSSMAARERGAALHGCTVFSIKYSFSYSSGGIFVLVLQVRTQASPLRARISLAELLVRTY